MSAKDATPARRRRGPSTRKRRAILEAARDLFLDNGFSGTSMDDVAARAGTSKQTVYAHFGDKPTLFSAMVTEDVGQVDEPGHPLAATMGQSTDLERDLREFARWHLALVTQPHLVRLRRMLIGEAERFPELAEAWYRNGPERSYELFATWFTELDRRGLLHTPDPLLAAQTFNWLVLSTPLNRAMSLPVAAPPPEEELHRYADEAVRVFLASYGPQSG